MSHSDPSDIAKFNVALEHIAHNWKHSVIPIRCFRDKPQSQSLQDIYIKKLLNKIFEQRFVTAVLHAT